MRYVWRQGLQFRLAHDQRFACKNSLTQNLEDLINCRVLFEFPLDRFLFPSYPDTKLSVPIRLASAFFREFVNASVRDRDKILFPACDAHAIHHDDPVGGENDLIPHPFIGAEDFFSPN